MSKRKVPANQKDLKLSIFERDNFTCKRCQNQKPIKRLTVHEGITICRPCRRKMRTAGDTSSKEISIADEEFIGLTLLEPTKEVNEEGYHFVRPAWHRRVYGGK